VAYRNALKGVEQLRVYIDRYYNLDRLSETLDRVVSKIVAQNLGVLFFGRRCLGSRFPNKNQGDEPEEDQERDAKLRQPPPEAFVCKINIEILSLDWSADYSTGGFN
jgi:hypothetical protein